MKRSVTYWLTTGLLAALSVFAAFTYLSGSPQAVEGFAHVGYPQQLRIILGIAKLLGAIMARVSIEYWDLIDIARADAGPLRIPTD
jgi:FtsH-binding integral membrane protein